MEIEIRRATAKDIISLASISYTATKYCDNPARYLGKREIEIIDEDYIENNIVFVAQKGHAIIGYCSLYEAKAGETKERKGVSSGYWLTHMFIRPAYVQEKIEIKFIEQVIEYCTSNNIRVFDVLSRPETKSFYREMGATYIKSLTDGTLDRGIEQFKFIIFNKQEDHKFKEKSNESALQHKLLELDRDAEEDEPYDASMYEENEPYDNSMYYEEDKLYDDSAYEEDRIYNEEIGEEKDEPYRDYLYRKNEIDEKEIYPEDKLYEADRYDNSELYVDYEDKENENNTYTEDVIDESDLYKRDIECEKITNQGEEVYENDIEFDKVQDKEQDKEQPVCRLSYEEFCNSTVPIGYKFECEEKLENKRMQKEEIQLAELSTEELDILMGKVYQEEVSREIEYQRVSKEMEAIAGGDRVGEQEAIYLETLADSGMKTEKQKMLEGDMYIAWGEEFVNDRRYARRLLREFNQIDPEDRRMTHSILKKLFGKVGDYIHIEPDFKCSYGYNIHIGESCYIGYNCIIVDHAPVNIGDNCIISPQVGLYTLAYPINAKMRISGYEYAKPITIGKNVWIGARATIMPGVSIGDNAVIAPGAIVKCNVPDNALVEGNPAKIINYIVD